MKPRDWVVSIVSLEKGEERGEIVLDKDGWSGFEAFGHEFSTESDFKGGRLIVTMPNYGSTDGLRQTNEVVRTHLRRVKDDKEFPQMIGIGRVSFTQKLEVWVDKSNID